MDKTINYLCVKLFKSKYGDREVELTPRVLTTDDRDAIFGSGSNGYITKARVKDNVLEFYHDWWNYGWLSCEEMYQDYPKAAHSAIKHLFK